MLVRNADGSFTVTLGLRTHTINPNHFNFGAVQAIYESAYDELEEALHEEDEEEFEEEDDFEDDDEDIGWEQEQVHAYAVVNNVLDNLNGVRPRNANERDGKYTCPEWNKTKYFQVEGETGTFYRNDGKVEKARMPASKYFEKFSLQKLEEVKPSQWFVSPEWTKSIALEQKGNNSLHFHRNDGKVAAAGKSLEEYKAEFVLMTKLDKKPSSIKFFTLTGNRWNVSNFGVSYDDKHFIVKMDMMSKTIQPYDLSGALRNGARKNDKTHQEFVDWFLGVED